LVSFYPLIRLDTNL